MYRRRPTIGKRQLPYFECADILRKFSDEELAYEVTQRHDDALTILHERFAPAILKIAKRIIGEASEAEDTVQQVFLEFHKSAGQLDASEGSVRSWLYCRGFQRAISKRAHLASIGFYKSRDFEGLEAEISRGAAEKYQLHLPELARLVDELLGNVSGLQRSVIELYLFEGLTMREIADRLHESFPKVRRSFYNGIKAMRTAIEQHHGDPNT